jgi:hypothetical protein
MMIPFLSGVVGFILTLIGLLVLLRKRRLGSPGMSRTGMGFQLVGIFLLLQITYLPIGLGLRNREVSRAKDFTEALIPKLEEYMRLNDTYPDNVDVVLTSDEKVPRLLQLSGDFPLSAETRRYYFQREGSYGFRFNLPDGFIGFQYNYCCGAYGEWTVSD